MVLRCYICENCEKIYEYQESIMQDPRTSCPECGKHVYQDLSGQYHIIVGEPTTVGQLAERNSKAMGKYLLEKKTEEDKEKRLKRKREYAKKAGLDPDIKTKKSWYNPEGKNLNKELRSIITSKDKTEKYILEGEK